MKKVTYNECGFDDIFNFAEEQKMASWNECCNLFHRSEILNYKEPTDISLKEIEADLKEPYESYAAEFMKKYKKAYEILIAYMNHHKVKKMHVTGA